MASFSSTHIFSSPFLSIHILIFILYVLLIHFQRGHFSHILMTLRRSCIQRLYFRGYSLLSLYEQKINLPLLVSIIYSLICGRFMYLCECVKYYLLMKQSLDHKCCVNHCYIGPEAHLNYLKQNERYLSPNCSIYQ